MQVGSHSNTISSLIQSFMRPLSTIADITHVLTRA